MLKKLEIKSSGMLLAGALAVVLGFGLTLGGLLSADEPVNFSYPGMKGKTVTLSDYRGKWVLVNFWATWCPPCLEEIPELVMFHELHHEDDAVVIGINYENVPEAKVQKFIDNYSISYPVARVSTDTRTPFGPIPGLPTSILINPEGIAVARQSGTVTNATIEAFIAAEEGRGGQP